MKGPAKLDCLDGLRGLAVLAVILFHHRIESERHARSSLYALLAPTRVGYVGVHLFLILSGFCLTHSLIRRSRSGRGPSLAGFLAARWWRIAPPFYVAMGVFLLAGVGHKALGIAPVRPEVLDVRQVATHALFLHGLWADTIEGINSPFWSLSLEFQFYATLPLLFALSERFGYRRVVAAVAAVSLAWRAVVVLGMPEHHFFLNGVFLGRWAEFAFGMLVASWFNDPARSPVAPGSPRVPVLVAIGLATFAAGLGGATAGYATAVEHAMGAGLALLLAATLLSSESGGGLARLFSWPPLVGVGVISYSLYLTHSLALAWIDRGYAHLVTEANPLTEAALLVSAAAAVGALGWGFFLLVERRFLRSVDARTPAPSPSGGVVGSPNRADRGERSEEVVGGRRDHQFGHVRPLGELH